MRLLFSVAVVLFAASAWAQPNPFYGPAPYPQLREFLQLTDSQLSAILEANRQYNEWTLEKQRHISDVQREIAQETAKSPLDPMGLGVRYAEIETICREVRDRAADLEKANVNLLTDTQKAKLKVLDDALRLWPTITEAQFARLLGGPTHAFPGQRIMGMVTITDRFNRTDGVRLGTVGPMIPGCSLPTPWFDTTEFRPTGTAIQMPSAVGAPAGRRSDGLAHRWFGSTKFASPRGNE